MTFGKMTAAVLVLTASAAFAQNSSSSTSATPRSVPGRQISAVTTTPSEDRTNEARMQTALHQRVLEMGKTMSQMQVLLKQMQAKVAASGSKDSIAKANVEMWQLMVTQLDQQYEQLRLATTAREDLEKRRNAMYKQAEMKAAMAASRAQGQSGATPASPSAQPGPAGQASEQAQPAPQSFTSPAPATSPN